MGDVYTVEVPKNHQRKSCQKCKHWDTGIFEEPCDSCKWVRRETREDAPDRWEPKED